MKTGEACNRTVIVVGRETPLDEAARLMREHHVGSLVVTEDRNGRRPVGIVTDRDMVVEVLAGGLDYRTVSVGEIMGARLVTAGEDDDTFDTLKLMRTHGLRRIPVVTPKGDLAGIVTADDLLAIIAEELGEIVGTVDRQPSHEAMRGGGSHSLVR